MSLVENTETLLGFVGRRVRQDLQFSAIFTVDLVASFAYVAATLLLLQNADLALLPQIASLAALYGALHFGKMWLIVELERRGGDAREFVGSNHLVTSGVYGWSRNPVYVISLAQSGLWSLVVVALALGQMSPLMAAVLGFALFYAHYWGMDRLIIPNEEAALKAVHPQEFAAYAGKVRRWVGRIG